MNTVIYHSYAWAADRWFIHGFSKQVASLCRDEKTRKETKPGEKPPTAEYLIMAQIFVQPTTVETYVHTLGQYKFVMQSYCASCKAGYGLCYHRAGLCWMQHLHWGEGMPTSKPATADYCPWIPWTRTKRTCSSLVPTWETHIERLPRSNLEAKLKAERQIQKNMHQGIYARYNKYNGDKKRDRC